MAKILLLGVQWAGDNAQSLSIWELGATCVPYRPLRDHWTYVKTQPPPKEGRGGRTFQTSIQSVLSLQATKLLNSDHCPAMARRSVLRESTTPGGLRHTDCIQVWGCCLAKKKNKTRKTITTRKQEIKKTRKTTRKQRKTTRKQKNRIN